MLVANYGSGSVACLPIELGWAAPAGLVVHPAPGQREPTRGGRKGPHAHSINLDAAGPIRRRGRPRARQGLHLPRSTTRAGTLTPNEPPFAKVAPASGPRHFAFHPDGRFGYVINEMANTVTAFAYDADSRDH